jgi:4-hydroxy-tetrahydrodipicolinate synthase
MNELIGMGVALVTPFNIDGTVDYKSLRVLVEYNIQNGTDYLVISGTTGESVTINKEEKHKIIETVASVNAGRLPLVIGIGGNNTASVVKEIRETDLSIFTAVLSVAPYYNKPTQEGLYQHFKEVAKVCSIPLILYNVPGRTSKNMEPSTTLRLARDFKNIIAVKEAGNDPDQYLELLNSKPKDFLIISGDDDLALNVVLAGASGVISVIGQAFPKEFSTLIRLGLQGKNKEAYKLHYKLMDIISMIFSENNPSGIKAVLQCLGITSNEVRLPLVKASEKLQKEITNFVTNLD